MFEFRGVDKFYFARIIKDDADGYVCDTPKTIPVQSVAKSTESSSETHFYDNKGMVVIVGEGADTITLVIAPPDLKELAGMIGRSFDADTGMMVEGPRDNAYYAIMYRTKGTDGKYRYVVRNKGQFNIPDEQNDTENNGTDTTNTTFEFTGIYTEHEFDKGIYNPVTQTWEKAGVKGIVVDTRYNAADLTNFFNAIQTPDTIQSSSDIDVTGVGVAPATASLVEGATLPLTATVVPANATDKSVSWSSSASGIASVDDDGVVTAEAEGTATITVTTTDGSFTDTCAVTVTAAP